MRTSAIVIAVVMIALGAYTLSPPLRGNADKVVSGPPSRAAASIPYEAQALAGAWGGALKSGVPIRLVVQHGHPAWAWVHVTWGEAAEGSPLQGALGTRAKILPDGRLCLSSPRRLILTLSEDARSLVGTSVHADPLASLLLTRVEEEWARTASSR